MHTSQKRLSGYPAHPTSQVTTARNADKGLQKLPALFPRPRGTIEKIVIKRILGERKKKS